MGASGHLQDLVLEALLEQILEVVGVEVVAADAEEEAVEDGGQRLVARAPRSRRRTR